MFWSFKFLGIGIASIFITTKKLKGEIVRSISSIELRKLRWRIFFIKNNIIINIEKIDITIILLGASGTGKVYTP